MKRISFAKLETSDLVVDAVYEGGRLGNAGDDPLPSLIGVSNMGGFRYLGSKESPRLIVLTSSFNDPDWPDRLDRETGVLTYFGDNKHPGRAIHETPRFGNLLLRDLFDAAHAHPPLRMNVAPILVFGNAGTFRDMIFLGLAVPGALQLHSMEDLVAVWKIADGQRFQNYRASLTIVNTPMVTRDWLNDIKSGSALTANCPAAWKKWVDTGACEPLKAERSVEHRTRLEQLPQGEPGTKVIRAIQEYFKDSPVDFEICAAKITQLMDTNFFSFDMTRPSRDGGRDAIGKYRIGHGPSAVFADFALEAKCYNMKNAVGVREVSRLISRLRHRQFGVLVTTSYLHSQAYKEIREDGHPVAVISARDIIEILARAGVNTSADVKNWLRSNFPVTASEEDNGAIIDDQFD